VILEEKTIKILGGDIIEILAEKETWGKYKES